MRLLMLSMLLFASASAAVADDGACVARSGGQRTHLLSLYTSEGCSSCPPADAWLRGIRADATVVPVEFHVDYWDSLGWKDRFADPRFSARQRQMAAHGSRPVVYTPEVALDGREWRDWSSKGLSMTRQPARVRLTLEITPGKVLRTTLRVAPTPSGGTSWHAYVAVTQDGLVSSVRAGENNGVVLRHDHVVRAFAGPLPLQQARATLRLPADLDPRRATVVAFVQDDASGAVLQVLSRPLADCGTAEP